MAPRTTAVMPARRVDEALRAPRFHQVYVALRAWIVDGTLEPGARLPAEPELCAAFGVSRITIRRAMDDLVGEGLVVRRQGSGTFVAGERGNAPVSLDLAGITDHVANLGRTTQVVDLEVAWVPADAPTRQALGLPAGTRVHQSRRVRVRDGQRIGLVTAWVTESVGRRLAKADLAQSTVLELIERAGVTVDSAEQTIGAALADIDAARALGVAVGVPLVRIERVVRGPDGVALERVVALWRADSYRYWMQLRRGRRGVLSGWIED